MFSKTGAQNSFSSNFSEKLAMSSKICCIRKPACSLITGITNITKRLVWNISGDVSSLKRRKETRPGMFKKAIILNGAFLV
ncbi:MAG: hypothetical protein DWQ05_06890 [Calditrichaeota bacterium]|nr:MAG: hypothetical protein DWQ05_06890 [Calditrichota bacterium]